MAKIYGLQGNITGKLGNSVMAVRNGEQIVRQYQPIVANPSTAAQVEARAKLKLMSQLSAVMAPYIAIPRVGAVSSRNRFVSENYGSATYSENTANINMSSVKLTKSVLGIATPTVTRAGSVLTFLFASNPGDYDRIVYVVISKGNDAELRAIGSVTSSDKESGFTATMEAVPGGETYVYAYGVRLNTEAARTIFGNMTCPTGADIAKLLVTSKLTMNDVSLSETVFTTPTTSGE